MVDRDVNGFVLERERERERGLMMVVFLFDYAIKLDWDT